MTRGAPGAPARVLVVGDANPDLLLRGDVVPRFGQAEQLVDAAELALGGSGAIMACGLARLGVPVALAAVVGDDLFGRFTLDALRDAGVSTDAVVVRAGEATGLSVHLAVPGDRAILTLPGTIPALTADAVRAAAAAFAPAHVHVASPFLTPALTADMPGLLAAWRAEGIGTSLDPNWAPAGEWDVLSPLLPHLDVLMPNAAEAAELARVVPVAQHGAAEPESAPHRDAAALAAHGPRVVVKAGADGGWSVDRARARHAAPGLRVDVVDTTGAGDTFDAGYVAAIAHGVGDEIERLRWAAAAGSLSTTGAGGTAAQPTLDELRSAMVDA